MCRATSGPSVTTTNYYYYYTKSTSEIIHYHCTTGNGWIAA
jgi:hypothetical protein